MATGMDMATAGTAIAAITTAGIVVAATGSTGTKETWTRSRLLRVAGAQTACTKYPASGMMAAEVCVAVSLKNPDAVAAIVTALRHVYGDEVARLMLVQGMSLADLIDAMLSAPLTHREAVRAITDSLDDFIISPDLGLMWHLKYIYGHQRGSLHVMDMEIATPDGTLASKDVWLRLSS